MVAVTEGTNGLEARKAQVKSLRQATPLSGHSIWAPPVGRPDLVTLPEGKAPQDDVLLRGRERAGHRGCDGVVDPAQRAQSSTAIREVGRVVRADERLVSALLPSGDGRLVAVKR